MAKKLILTKDVAKKIVAIANGRNIDSRQTISGLDHVPSNGGHYVGVILEDSDDPMECYVKILNEDRCYENAYHSEYDGVIHCDDNLRIRCCSPLLTGSLYAGTKVVISYNLDNHNWDIISAECR